MLGALLLENGAWDRIADLVGEQDFYRYDHRLIFRHIVRLINVNRPADVITVYETLTGEGKSEEVGGLSYLNAMAQNTPSSANIRRCAEIVRERGVMCKLLAAIDDISAMAFNPQGKDGKQILDEAESRILHIRIDPAVNGHDHLATRSHPNPGTINLTAIQSNPPVLRDIKPSSIAQLSCNNM